MKKILSAIILTLSLSQGFAKTLSPVVLKGELGGKVDGTPWDSSKMKGKVSIIFYVDPDRKNVNNDLSDVLKDKNYSLNKVQYYGIINMDASWLPNWAIEGALEEKQKAYPDTIYVKDMKKTLVNKWGLQDDASVIVVLDKTGKVIYNQYGRHESGQIAEVVKLIESQIK